MLLGFGFDCNDSSYDSLSASANKSMNFFFCVSVHRLRTVFNACWMARVLNKSYWRQVCLRLSRWVRVNSARAPRPFLLFGPAVRFRFPPAGLDCLQSWEPSRSQSFSS